MSANLMGNKESSCWAKNDLSFSQFYPCLFCCVWRWGRKRSAQPDGGNNPSSNNFNSGKSWQDCAWGVLELSSSSSIQGGSSSAVPIRGNQGVHLNPLNTTSQLSFPLSLGMFRLFVSYLFLIIYIFITFTSSGFIWQHFLKFFFSFSGSRVSIVVLHWCAGALSVTWAWQQGIEPKTNQALTPQWMGEHPLEGASREKHLQWISV